MPTSAERLQTIFDEFKKAGNKTPASAHAVAEWAIRNGLYTPRPADLITVVANQLSDALRQEYFVDDRQRKVRTKHAAPSSQGNLWDDIRTAPRQHMELAFKYRRHGIVSDCHQLKVDVDFYNSIHPDERPIQIPFDFRDDVEELDVTPAGR